jgi:death-on-curing protein
VQFEEVIFLELEDVERFHTLAIERFGGTAGVRDRGLLESAVMAPRSGYYATLAELAAVYMHGIAKNHAFVDGNKRTAFIAALSFLEVNGRRLKVGAEWVGHVEQLAAGAIDREAIAVLLADAMGDPVRLDST